MASPSEPDRAEKPSALSTPPASSADASSSSSDDKHASTDPASTSSSSATVKAPAVNVWSQRKEQMAAQARSTSQTRPLNPLSPANASAGKISPSSVNSQSGPNGVSVRGTSAVRSQNTAPAVPSSGSGQTSRAPPPVEDAESWPEVGKTVAQPTPRPPQSSIAKSGEERQEQDEKSEASHSSGPHKKSEWPFMTLVRPSVFVYTMRPTTLAVLLRLCVVSWKDTPMLDVSFGGSSHEGLDILDSCVLGSG